MVVSCSEKEEVRFDSVLLGGEGAVHVGEYESSLWWRR